MTHYLVYATVDGAAVYYGHTENLWMATNYKYSIENNLFLMEAWDNDKKSISDNVNLVCYTGNLSGFYEFVLSQTNVQITGEDLIGVFYTGEIGDTKNTILPKLSIISTCRDVLGDFPEYANRFIYPNDIMKMQRAFRLFTRLIGCIRDVTIREGILSLFMSASFLEASKLMSSDESSSIDTDTIDIVRYGLQKGWYVPL